jgi:hypothetical protein
MEKDDLARPKLVNRNGDASVAKVGLEAMSLDIVADRIFWPSVGHHPGNSASNGLRQFPANCCWRTLNYGLTNSIAYCCSR